MAQAGLRSILPALFVLSLVTAVPAVGASRQVLLKDVQFEPNRLEIAAGETVTWRYQSGGDHTVTFEGGPDLHDRCPGLLLSNCMNEPGETAERTFPEPGEYPYFCKIHRNANMTGVIVVKADPETVPPPASGNTQPPSSSTTVTTKPASTTTTTTRPLTTSSTVVRSTTTLADTTTTLTPNEPPVFDPGSDGGDEKASGKTDASGVAGGAGGGDGGDDAGAVAVIVALLLAVSAGGGYLLWRLRPNRSA